MTSSDTEQTPWEPASLRLRVGDRVRFRRGECDRSPIVVGDGETGVVIALATDDPFVLPFHCRLNETQPAEALAAGHPYAVELDSTPIWGWAARAELERLP